MAITISPAISALLAPLQQALPHLIAVYLFGSHAKGQAGPDSDVDLAVLVEGKVEVVQLWELAQSLAANLDLVDLRAASTVLQYQIITEGLCLWKKDVRAGIYEAAILSDKTDLDEARAPLLAEIQRQGRVYGK